MERCYLLVAYLKFRVLLKKKDRKRYCRCVAILLLQVNPPGTSLTDIRVKFKGGAQESLRSSCKQLLALYFRTSDLEVSSDFLKAHSEKGRWVCLSIYQSPFITTRQNIISR
jgi:hypothetical protein